MMLERMKEGMYFASPLEWDIKLIYPKEYRYAMTVVEELQQELGQRFLNRKQHLLHYILLMRISI